MTITRGIAGTAVLFVIAACASIVDFEDVAVEAKADAGGTSPTSSASSGRGGPAPNPTATGTNVPVGDAEIPKSDGSITQADARVCAPEGEKCDRREDCCEGTCNEDNKCHAGCEEPGGGGTCPNQFANDCCVGFRCSGLEGECVPCVPANGEVTNSNYYRCCSRFGALNRCL